MVVKIGDKIHNSINEPILLIVNDAEKTHIGTMNGKKYCSFPEVMSCESAKEFMKVSEDVLASVEY